MRKSLWYQPWYLAIDQCHNSKLSRDPEVAGELLEKLGEERKKHKNEPGDIMRADYYKFKEVRLQGKSLFH